MSGFKKAFKDLSSQFDRIMDRIEGHSHPQQQYPGAGYSPPPVPFGSHPGSPQPQQPYGYPPQPYQYHQYPGQQYPGQQYPGQQYPGQQYPGQQYPGQQQPPIPPRPYQTSPPPVPSSSRPAPTEGDNPPPYSPSPQSSQPSTNHVYYCPLFAPHIPVSEYFSFDLGAGGWGNDELETYTSYPANSFHTQTHQLVIRAIVDTRQKADRDRYTSARLVTKQRLEKRRGFLCCVMQAPCAKGIWPAFWLLPEEPFSWPTDGEVDVFEAWNGGNDNHSCLHWGGYSDPADKVKHRTVVTRMDDVRNVHEYGFAWDQSEDGESGRMVWYIDGKAVMKVDKPAGTRRLECWRVLLNIAMGGTVCNGVKPDNGNYDMVITRLMMSNVPPRGWDGFEEDYKMSAPGRTLK